MKTNYNILARANKIINERSEEKNRQYGDMDESMEKAARIATQFRGQEIDIHTMFCAMIGLKGARISHSLRMNNDLPSDPDSMCDLTAYIGAWQNYSNNLNMKQTKIDENENIKRLYRDLYFHGEEIEVRGLKTKELQNYQIVFKPYQRFINFPSRKLSLKYIKEELYWYFNADKNDLSICEHAKIWKDLVNDDKTINSNYGAIIFNGQFERIITTLCNDKYSRRAVIMIGDNDNLSDEETKDIKCTNSIVFSIRNNKLEMFVHMRSNDAIFGLCNDVPFFSIIHEMAYVLLKNVMYEDLIYGNYTHYVNSLHIYERHFHMLKKIVLLDEEIEKVDCPKISCCNEVEFLKQMKYADNVENKLKTIQYENNPEFYFIKWLLSK